MRAFLVFAILLAGPSPGFPSWEEAAAYLAGAVEMEEMEEETLERFENLHRRPLHLNNASRSAMLSSGLMTPYQAASILDVLRRTGAVRSFTELSMIDGIGEKTAEALRFFVSLEAGAQNPEGGGVRGEAAIRGGVRVEGGTPRNEAAAKDAERVRLECGDRFRLSVGTNTPYDGKRVGTASLSMSSRDGRFSILAGDLNARFGQGLVLWSGMTLSGISGVDAMVRKGGGVSASSSFSGSGRLRGAALDYDAGPSRVVVLVSEKCLAANGNLYWKRSQAGMTVALSEALPVGAFDFRCNMGGVDLWGEGAAEFRADGHSFRIVPAGLAGVSWSPEYGTVIALLGRLYPSEYVGSQAGALRSASKTSDESGLGLAGRIGPFSACADYAFHPSNGRRQLKTTLLAGPAFKIGDATFTPSFRHALRWRPYEELHFRNDIRLDADLLSGIWQYHARYNTLWYRDRSWAWYCEAVCRDPERRFQASARAGLFKVDNWDDRIYVYERDLPGCFTVPSLYGRGWNCSATAGFRFHPKDRYMPATRLDFRAGITSYPWTRPAKPSRFEMRAQCSVSW